MLDINEFIIARGGNPERIQESQRRRGASVEVVDQVIGLFDNHQQGKHSRSVYVT
jgi:seryl-tRNA synthetase